MKKILKVITAAALSALMVAAPVSAVMAAQTSETVAAGFTVLNVTAAELSENSGAIHQALECSYRIHITALQFDDVADAFSVSVKHITQF